MQVKEREPADKPGSVVGNHSSGPAVTGGLKQPTRKHRGPRHSFPIWSCSRWGLPCRRVLPPARCALTAPFHPYPYPAVAGAGGIFSVALSVGSRPPGITWHPALWSPDFPPRSKPMAETERLPGRLPGPFSPTGAQNHRAGLISAGLLQLSVQFAARHAMHPGGDPSSLAG